VSGYDINRESLPNYAEREAPYIRARLETLKAQIESVGHGAAVGYWVGDVAGKRQISHDWASGRASWHRAAQHVEWGLKALGEGNHDFALSCLLEAQAFAVAALGVRLATAARKGAGLDLLAKPAGKAGAPRKHPIKPAGPTRPRGRPRKKVYVE
jgi:hypothetical protein